MTTLNAVLESQWRGVLAGAPDVGTAEQEFHSQFRQVLANGTGADQANQFWADTAPIAGSRSLDLAGGVTNALGETLTFAAIKAFRIRAARDNVAAIVVGGAGANTFTGWFADATDKIAVPPGGMFEIVNPSAAGWTVTAGTGDVLLIAGTNADDYTVEIIGEA